MKKTLDIKKLILLNMPYILMGLFATNFGEAWRMAQGADASEKFLSLVSVLPGALQSFWPSLHPLDLFVGLCCGGSLRLAVYLKSKNAKKYRHGLEYGDGAVCYQLRRGMAAGTGVKCFREIPFPVCCPAWSAAKFLAKPASVGLVGRTVLWRQSEAGGVS